MGEELARHKEALKVYQTALRELGLDYAHFTETVEKRVAAVLEPVPEVEDVMVGSWFVIPTDGDVYTQVSKERAAQMKDEGYQVAFLSAIVKRPVKRPMVKEVDIHIYSADLNYPPEIRGKTGTFRYTD